MGPGWVERLARMKAGRRRGDLSTTVRQFLQGAKRSGAAVPEAAFVEVVRVAERVGDPYLAMSVVAAMGPRANLEAYRALVRTMSDAGMHQQIQSLLPTINEALKAHVDDPHIAYHAQRARNREARHPRTDSLQFLRQEGASMAAARALPDPTRLRRLMGSWHEWISAKLYRPRMVGRSDPVDQTRSMLSDTDLPTAVGALSKTLHAAARTSRSLGNPTLARSALSIFRDFTPLANTLPNYLIAAAYAAQSAANSPLHEVRALSRRVDDSTISGLTSDPELLHHYISAVLGWKVKDTSLDTLENRLRVADGALRQAVKKGLPAKTATLNLYATALARRRDPRAMAKWVAHCAETFSLSPDESTYAAMLESCILDNRQEQSNTDVDAELSVDFAESFLEHMGSTGIQISERCQVVYLSVLAHADCLNRGLTVIKEWEVAFPETDPLVWYRILMKGLARNPFSDATAASALLVAKAAVISDTELDADCLGTILVACNRSSEPDSAKEWLVERMPGTSLTSVGIAAYIGLLSKFCDSGFWEETREYVLPRIEAWRSRIDQSTAASRMAVPALRSLHSSGRSDIAKEIQAIMADSLP